MSGWWLWRTTLGWITSSKRALLMSLIALGMESAHSSSVTWFGSSTWLVFDASLSSIPDQTWLQLMLHYCCCKVRMYVHIYISHTIFIAHKALEFRGGSLGSKYHPFAQWTMEIGCGILKVGVIHKKNPVRRLRPFVCIPLFLWRSRAECVCMGEVAGGTMFLTPMYRAFI